MDETHHIAQPIGHRVSLFGSSVSNVAHMNTLTYFHTHLHISGSSIRKKELYGWTPSSVSTSPHVAPMAAAGPLGAGTRRVPTHPYPPQPETISRRLNFPQSPEHLQSVVVALMAFIAFSSSCLLLAGFGFLLLAFYLLLKASRAS